MCSQIQNHKTKDGDRSVAEVPSVPEIQSTLVDLGDKPRKFLNSKEWIGAVEVNKFLSYQIILNY